MLVPPRRNELAITQEGRLSLRFITYLEDLADEINTLDGEVDVIAEGSEVSKTNSAVLFNECKKIQDLQQDIANYKAEIAALRTMLHEHEKAFNDIRNLIDV